MGHVQGVYKTMEKTKINEQPEEEMEDWQYGGSKRFNPADLERRRTEALEKGADALARLADVLEILKEEKDERDRGNSTGNGGDTAS